MISQAEFLDVSQPFQLSRAIRSVGSSTPDLVVSKQSKIYLRSQTSCSDMFLVTKCLGSYQRRSFRLKRVQQTLERPMMTQSLPWLLQADLPGLQFFLGLERLYLSPLKELVTILLWVGLIIKIYLQANHDSNQYMNENEEEGQLILGRYKKIRFISQEDRADKYLLKDVFGGERVEVKAQRVGEPKPTVLHEAGFLQQMQGYPGFPLMIWSGNFNNQEMALITEKLGPSLSQLIPFGKTHFSLTTALLIGQELIRLLQILHDKHAVLGNFSLQNFKISAKSVDKITVSSLYACRRYRSSRTLKHYKVKQVDYGQFINHFMSFNRLANMSTSRRDDLESFFFFMVFIVKGKLPWSHVPLSLKNIAKTQEKIYTIMEPLFANSNSQVKEQLLQGMPAEFSQILEHICALKFQERPNYSLVRMKLRKMLMRVEKDTEPRFEWISTLSKLKYEGPKEIQLYTYADIKALKSYYLPLQVKIELDSIENGIGQYKSNGSPRKKKLKKGTCEVM